MARLFSSGFELNSKTSNLEWTSFSGTNSIVSSSVRSGSYALRINPTAGSSTALYNFAAVGSGGNSLVFARAYINIASLPSSTIQLLTLQNDADGLLASIQLKSDGTLILYDELTGGQIGSPSNALNLNQHYRIELMVNMYDTSATILAARLEGSIFAIDLNRDFSIAAGTGSEQIRLGNSTGTSTFDITFDDIAVNDDSGTSQNYWPGQGSIIHLQPNAAGDSTQWAPDSGSNYARVNEVTPDDATSYVQDSTVNHSDLYNMSNSGILVNDVVTLVQVGVRFRNDVADASTQFKVQLEKAASGTIVLSSGIIANSTTWKTNAAAAPYNYPITLYTDTNSLPWIQQTLDSIQAGIKTTAVGTHKNQISSIWTLVEYYHLKGFDPHQNFSYSTVATAPSPSSSGNSLVVHAGDGAAFPAIPFDAVVWPVNSQPTNSNAEIIRVTNVSTDTFTIARSQEGSSARSIQVGDQIANNITKKIFSDIETSIKSPSTVVVAANNSLNKMNADYICDGTADDVQLQAAIDALPLTGGKVILLEGIFNISAAININKNGVTVEGMGKGTIITITNNNTIPVFDLGDNINQYQNCTISDIYFDGNKVNQTSGRPAIQNSNYLYKMNYTAIQRCFFINLKDAAVQDLGSYGEMNECIIQDCDAFYNGVLISINEGTVTNCIFNISNTTAAVIGGSGMKIVSGCKFYLPSMYNTSVISGVRTVVDNYIFFVGDTGTLCYAISGCYIASNNFIYCDYLNLGNMPPEAFGNGIYLCKENYIRGFKVAVQVPSGSPIIEGNYFYQCNTGVALGEVDTFTISGNSFVQLYQSQIILTDSKNGSIVGNSFNLNGLDTNNSYSGILLQGAIANSQYISIVSNIFKNDSSNKLKYCIRENTSSDGPCTITGNICRGAATTQISTQNGSTVSANNITA